MSITLSKAETKLLLEAAGCGGILPIPQTLKAVTRDRMLGRFEAEGFIEAGGQGATEPHLTPAGYRAVGRRPPRKPARVSTSSGSPATQPGTKASLVRALLERPDGATLDELIGATGWLPHTTRAALSRIRSAGQVLAKTARPDGRTAYRIDGVRPEPAAKGKRARKAPALPPAALQAAA